jgi:hypothetical protein
LLCTRNRVKLAITKAKDSTFNFCDETKRYHYMKRFFKLSYLLLALLGAATVTTQTSCSSSQKGFNYSSHNKRNKKNQRFVNSRVKKTGGDHTKVKCKPH